MMIHPDSPTELRDRGLIYGEMQKTSQAIADLRRYLEVVGEAEDRNAITERLRQLQTRQTSQN